MQYYHYNGTHSSKCHTLHLSFQMETKMFRKIHFILKGVYKSSNSRKSINFLDFLSKWNFTFCQQRCQISKINTFMVQVSYNTICNFTKIEKFQHSESVVFCLYSIFSGGESAQVSSPEFHQFSYSVYYYYNNTRMLNKHTSTSPNSRTHILTTSALECALEVSIVTECLVMCFFMNFVRSLRGLLILTG